MKKYIIVSIIVVALFVGGSIAVVRAASPVVLNTADFSAYLTTQVSSAQKLQNRMLTDAELNFVISTSVTAMGNANSPVAMTIPCVNGFEGWCHGVNSVVNSISMWYHRLQ